MKIFELSTYRHSARSPPPTCECTFSSAFRDILDSFDSVLLRVRKKVRDLRAEAARVPGVGCHKRAHAHDKEAWPCVLHRQELFLTNQKASVHYCYKVQTAHLWPLQNQTTQRESAMCTRKIKCRLLICGPYRIRRLKESQPCAHAKIKYKGHLITICRSAHAQT